MIAMFDIAAKVTGDPLLGLRVGEAMQPSDFGMWTRYAMAAPTLRRAVTRMVRSSAYYQGRNSIVAWCHGDTSVFAYSAGRQTDFDQRHHADHIIAPILRLMQAYGVSPPVAVTILVPHGDRHHRRVLEDALQLPVVYSPSLTGLAFPRHYLESPRLVPLRATAQPSMSELRAMVRARPPRSMAELVLSTIHTQLLNRQVSIDATAAQLHISTRSLQRQLMNEGTSFRELVDRARRDRAVALLVDSDEPVSDIGTSLGYEDTSHFTRAFRRWFGTTPSSFRNPSASVLGRSLHSENYL